METRILRLAEVIALTGLSRSTIYRLMAKGEFPEAVNLGGSSGRAIGWKAEEVYDWIDRLERRLTRATAL